MPKIDLELKRVPASSITMNNKLLLFTRVSIHHRKKRQKILGVCNLVKRQKKKRKEKTHSVLKVTCF